MSLEALTVFRQDGRRAERSSNNLFRLGSGWGMDVEMGHSEMEKANLATDERGLARIGSEDGAVFRRNVERLLISLSFLPTQRRAEEVHPVGAEKLVKLLQRQDLVDGGRARVLSHLAEEFLHLARGLVDIDQPAEPVH